ncbi:unnamed protein product [Tuber melanosporum]|uniref:(Perigord truffle) hypothetical protein n=1 Tax=Tuber melanosporum (strain Mel28) TaxID=656061 RepID=D5GK34_TUBMM|nr:uncharacterized protein GSTUM_00009342001 [Tuber melanosporum]CAZ84877.1 unnamed protein product [Tuber melanosporum]
MALGLFRSYALSPHSLLFLHSVNQKASTFVSFLPFLPFIICIS